MQFLADGNFFRPLDKVVILNGCIDYALILEKKHTKASQYAVSIKFHLTNTKWTYSSEYKANNG